MNIKSYDFYYELRSLPFVEAIILYGSRARGDNQERSDIDLAIVCPKASDDDWRLVREIINNADTLLTIDCVRLDNLSDLKLKSEIEKNKVVLFERKKNSYPWYESFLDLGEAIGRLEEIILEREGQASYIRDAAIQRFEYCIELFWKVLKKLCQEEGFETNSPKSTLQKAYALKLIDDEQTWLDMMEDRNLTSHTYKLQLAREIYTHIRSYYFILDSTYQRIKEKYKL